MKKLISVFLVFIFIFISVSSVYAVNTDEIGDECISCYSPGDYSFENTVCTDGLYVQLDYETHTEYENIIKDIRSLDNVKSVSNSAFFCSNIWIDDAFDPFLEDPGLYTGYYMSSFIYVRLSEPSEEKYSALFSTLSEKEYTVQVFKSVRMFAKYKTEERFSECSPYALFAAIRGITGEEIAAAETILESSGLVLDYERLSPVQMISEDPPAGITWFYVSVKPSLEVNYTRLYAQLTQTGFFCSPDYLADGSSGSDHYYGDFDLNGKVGADDARSILRLSVGLELYSSFLQYVVADVDCDGEITAGDARAALRISVGLEKKNVYHYGTPQNGLISSVSLGLTEKNGKLIISASTVGTADAVKTGFAYIKLQKSVNGVWTDCKDHIYTDIYGDSSSKVWSVSVSVPSGGTYRAVCEHYAQTKGILSKRAASIFSVSRSVSV